MKKDYQPKFNNTLSFGRTAVLYGGTSSERDVSLKSGQAVLDALNKSSIDAMGVDVNQNAIEQLQSLNIDHAFIVLHGAGGEDGKIQAVLDYLQIPYTGSNHASSALAMDKLRTKQVWQALGLPTPQYFIADQLNNWNTVLNDLGGAAFVKPIHEGSSIGLSLVNTPDELEQAFKQAQKFDRAVLVEKKIVGNEYTIAILNGSALPVVRVKTNKPFYDFDAKYLSNATEYFCPCGLSPDKELELQELAYTAFTSIGCQGWGRVDVMQDELGNFYLLEINTVPGMTDHSLVPMAAKSAGLSFDDLVLEILAGSVK